MIDLLRICALVRLRYPAMEASRAQRGACGEDGERIMADARRAAVAACVMRCRSKSP